MRCPSCHARVSRRVKYCPECGTDVVAPTHLSLRRDENALGLREGSRLRGRSPMADDDEEIIWEGSFSTMGLIHWWLLVGVVTCVLPIGAQWAEADQTQWLAIAGLIGMAWLGMGAVLAFLKLNARYVLTNHRLIHRTGILWQRTDRMELIDMSDVSHEQSIIERLVNVGTIEVTSSDRSHPYIDLPGICPVDRVAMLIDDARLRERARRGVHVEQI